MHPLPPGSPSEFDLILVVIAVAMLAGGAIGWLSTVPLRVAGGAGSLVAYAAMFYGLAIDPSER